MVTNLFYGLTGVASLVMVATIGFGFYMLMKKDLALFKRIKKHLIAGQAAAFGLFIVVAIIAFITATPSIAETTAQVAATPDLGDSIRRGLGYVGMGVSTGCAAIGAGVGAGIAGAAGIGAVSEKPEMLAKTLIYVGLAEGAAIYGLLISFIIMNKI